MDAWLHTYYVISVLYIPDVYESDFCFCFECMYMQNQPSKYRGGGRSVVGAYRVYS